MLFQTKYLKCAAKIKETHEIWALSAIILTSGWAAGFHTFTEFPQDWHTCSPGCITSSTNLKIDTEIRPVVLFVDVWQHDFFINTVTIMAPKTNKHFKPSFFFVLLFLWFHCRNNLGFFCFLFHLHSTDLENHRLKSLILDYFLYEYVQTDY